MWTDKFIIFLGGNKKQFKNIWTKKEAIEKRKIFFQAKKVPLDL